MSNPDSSPQSGRLTPARIVALILAVLATVTVTVTFVDDDGPGGTPPRPKVVVKIDRDASAANEPNGPEIGAHEDLKDETPVGVNENAVEKGLQQRSAPGITAPRPVGGAQNYSCPSTPVRNQSSRAGQKPLLFVLHYTVSAPGSGPAIVRLFDTPSFGASSTFVAEFSGWCRRLMSDAAKPWTQGNFNGRSISIEIVARGTETRAQWLASKLIKGRVLSSLMYDRMRANGIPIRWVDPVGCTVQKAGWTDHNALECGNDHHDVTPNFPYDEIKRQLAAKVKASGAAAARRGKVCNQLRWHRAKAKRSGWTPARVARVNQLKAQAKTIGLNAAKCKA